MQKIDLILLKYGEIALKGLNKPLFERKLLDNIKSRLDRIGGFRVRRAQSTVYVEPLDESADMQEALKILEKIFGIVNICPVVKCEKNMESIARTAIECVNELSPNGKSFKVEAKREDKKFPLNSPQIARELGGMILDGVQINTPNEGCAPHILNVSFEYVKSEVLLHSLEIDGIYVSSGSACSSHKKGPSYVLTAIGVDRRMIDGSIRFSLSEFTTAEEIDYTITKLAEHVRKIRKLMKK